ncbi:heme/hemin ABC transporter substrate-binding protein [Williamsia sterculiae]|uniref:Iron complex transport system substrate-binding protein n=1 Tax=Williamsia sterculiae TaxID=1344003 RepID=A0A1N7GRI2_9NOCA|nr:ABC transporter substrate-binding protein [Williamsia sterculiae]SIS15185.1 iron complex transport system substrate-binding protein [Williamsia sterculiae]
MTATLWASGCSTAPLDVGHATTAAVATGPRTATIPSADPIPVAESPTPRLPATVRTHDGHTVTVTDVSRIVALDRYGSYGTAVFALGLGRNLVGRDIATKFPAAAAVPLMTPGGTDANVEAIIAQRPTVVLTDASLPNAAVLERQLTSTGILVVVGDADRTVAGTDALLRFTAAALGVPGPGDQLTHRVDTQLADAKRAIPPDADRPRIAFVYARGTGLLILGGPGSGADSLIDAIGGRDAGTAAGLTDAFTSLTSEGLIKAAPDVLLMMSDGLASVGGVDGLLKVPGVAETPAGRNRRVIDMDDGELLSFGARTGDVAMALSRALYGPR